MDYLFENIDTIKFDQLKSFVSNLDMSNNIDFDKLNKLLSFLETDTRKNRNTLAVTLQNKINKYHNEIERIKNMYAFDNSFGNFNYIVGVDEVGRGPLAGPIVAAAVVLKKKEIDSDLILGLKDSKQLTEKKREQLYDIITSKAIDFYIAELSSEQIDNLGLAYCNNQIFIESIEGLKQKPDFVLTDGYPVKNYNINNVSVIKGDQKSASIAAASIIAKVYRDRLMKEYSLKYPEYSFDKNVGYGTREHIEAIKKYGLTPIHRLSFLKSIIDLNILK